ncbi:hypothetical protein DTO166G4_7762 [Paecilomyces variotii]|nr:hypothetical protein DTO166G4_7762 [Paecilomyces variotii]KAJ9228745.1 hypothetical protein DTO166G5_8374 [Paecilomyces variotii]KAJ9319279.1 hypothetical protein DTO271D3_48 [Paecilomyces variotii]
MPIAALPQSTARAIGSTSVLSDTCSVVKELLDNSLDAGASSVSIEVSQNTVDLIQVKDNGHGIPPEDHGFVCKRSFTSKIQTLDDLRNVGGTSLGFRGEALASACEMSGGVSVTTRVESQVVGATLKYSRTGDLASSQRASHPVGTTVRLTDFLKHIPVRRQAALKSASKTITRIKKLLQAYAIAQPSKRISFRVINSKNENNNWTYAPKPNTTLREAALLVAGPETASHCAVITWPSQESKEHETEQELEQNHTVANYELTAFLPKADSDFTKVSGGGQYVSVDGRPVSASRGKSRDIIKLFRTYIRSAAKIRGNSASLSDPFLCLHIRCPKGSYDANIEPAKDDVLFTDSAALISLSESLFKSVYGEVDHGDNLDAPASKTSKTSHNDSCIREPAEAESAESYHSQETPATSQTSFVSGGMRQSSICQALENEKRSTSRNETPMRSGNIDISNPWAIARLNTSTRSADSVRPHLSQLLTPSRTKNTPESLEVESMNNRHSGSPPLPSPSNSEYSLPSSGSRRSSLFVQRPQRNPACAAYTRSDRDIAKERYGNGALDTWFQKVTQSSFKNLSTESTAEEIQDVVTKDRAADRFGKRTHPPQASPLRDFADDVGNKRTQTSIDDIDVPRISGREHSLVEDTEDIRQSEDTIHRRQEFPVLEQWSSRLHQSSASEYTSETEIALDFERRKRAAIQSRRLQTKAFLGSAAPREDEPPSSSPHHNRYLAARAALAAPVAESRAEMPPSASTTGTPSPAPLNPNDPRAYFIRHRDPVGQTGTSTTGPKIRRVHTSKFPLERIPEGSDLHDIGLRLAINVNHLSSSFVEICRVDSYSQSGSSSEAFSATPSKQLQQLWNARLSDLIKKKYRTVKTDEEPHIPFELSTIKSQGRESSD